MATTHEAAVAAIGRLRTTRAEALQATDAFREEARRALGPVAEAVAALRAALADAGADLGGVGPDAATLRGDGRFAVQTEFLRADRNRAVLTASDRHDADGAASIWIEGLGRAAGEAMSAAGVPAAGAPRPFSDEFSFAPADADKAAIILVDRMSRFFEEQAW